MGDKVWVDLHLQIKKGRTKKLSPKWDGPWDVTNKTSPVNYRVRRKKGEKWFTQRVHVSRMRPFKEKGGEGKAEEAKNPEEIEVNEGFIEDAIVIEGSREAPTIQEAQEETLEKRKIRQIRDEREDGEKRKEYLILWEGEEEVPMWVPAQELGEFKEELVKFQTEKKNSKLTSSEVATHLKLFLEQMRLRPDYNLKIAKREAGKLMGEDSAIIRSWRIRKALGAEIKKTATLSELVSLVEKVLKDFNTIFAEELQR